MTDPESHVRRWLPWMTLGSIIAAASTFFPPSTDETAWLGVTRKWAAGASLYRTAIDNKSPGLLAIVRFLDVHRWFVPLRSVAVGLLCAWIAYAAARLAIRLNADAGIARKIGLVVAISAALQSILALTPEMLTIAAVLGAMLAATAGRGRVAGIVAALSLVFDPRAVALAPAVILLCDGWRIRRRAAVSFGVVAAAYAWLVLASPDLRYALIQLNLTTSSLDPWSPARQVVVAVEAMLFPVVATLAAAGGLRLPDAGRNRMLIAAAFVPPVAVTIASVHGFDHYWTLVLPAFPLVLAWMPRTGSPHLRAGLALAALAAVPALLHAGVALSDERTAFRRYDAVAAVLRQTMRPGESFVQFDAEPYLGALLPEKLGASSPLLGYLLQPTPRREKEMASFARALDRAAVITDAGGLSVPEDAVLAPYRGLWRLFRSRLAGFGCPRTVRGITIRYRLSRCP